MEYNDVIDRLKSLSDEKFKAFNSKIINSKLPQYGVRTPALRSLGKLIKKDYPSFIDDFFLHTEYSFEEVLLCGWQMGADYKYNVQLLKRLIPRMDSWAHTDQVINKFKWVNDTTIFLQEFAYLKSGSEYEVRAYVMMMFCLCINSEHLPLIARELPSIPLGKHYYVDMATAWLICEVIVKFYDDGVNLLSSEFLPQWVVKKAVSKCCDSFRLTPEQKNVLRDLAARKFA